MTMQKGTIFAGFSPAGAKTGSPLPEKSPTLILKSRRVLLYQSVPQNIISYVICDSYANFCCGFCYNISLKPISPDNKIASDSIG
jgi:hypothetical protein